MSWVKLESWWKPLRARCVIITYHRLVTILRTEEIEPTDFSPQRMCAYIKACYPSWPDKWEIIGLTPRHDFGGYGVIISCPEFDEVQEADPIPTYKISGDEKGMEPA